MARTREEHIEKLGDALSAGYSSVALAGMRRGLAKQHILEAEQRGYERARAECAEDTKRLAFMCGVMSDEEAMRVLGIRDDTGDPVLWREAIDAAMKEDGQ